MITTRLLLGDSSIASDTDQRIPGTADTGPGTGVTSPSDQAAGISADIDAARQAAQSNLGTAVAIACGVAAVLGIAGLLFFVREPATKLRHRTLRVGDHFCKGHVRYEVAHSGRLQRIGNC